MQGLHTHTAMRHADLPLTVVWDHFLNMGGSIGHVEVEAYLHGLMPLPEADRDCVAQAVNELLDDFARAGYHSCCRAPYSGAAAAGDARRIRTGTCTAAGGGHAVGRADAATGTARLRLTQAPLRLRRAVHRER